MRFTDTVHGQILWERDFYTDRGEPGSQNVTHFESVSVSSIEARALLETSTSS